MGMVLVLLYIQGCQMPARVSAPVKASLPAQYAAQNSATSSALKTWKQYFSDPFLQALIDTALAHNQELNIARQEILVAQSEARARKGEYLPFVGLRAGAGLDKVGRYTLPGATVESLNIEPEKKTVEPIPDFMLGAAASWELDIWHKLRNSQKAAVNRYLATTEGKNYATTQLVAEVASSYYELLALDKELDILRQNIRIQSDAFEIVKTEKQASRLTELAVKRFEAQLLNTKGLQYNIQQKITETENRIHYLTGVYGTAIKRSATDITEFRPDTVLAGVPAQLLQNRPDVRAAELGLAAAHLDVQAARAAFYPSLRLSAAVGLNAYQPQLLLQAPESMLFNLLGDALLPLVNRNALHAQYAAASAKQQQALLVYERTALSAYLEVINQMAMINNMAASYTLKTEEVAALNQSVNISGQLFRNARADYMEVLLTQRDALESRFQLVEIKMKQLNAWVNAYKALGGGWN